MHQDEQSRQQRGKQPSVKADAGRTNGQSRTEPLRKRSARVIRRCSAGNWMSRQRRSRAAAEPSRRSRNLGGERNREGVGNLVSGDKTLLESPERGKGAASAVSGLRLNGKNGKNKKKRAA